MDKQDLDSQNSTYWSEPCGSNAAVSMNLNLGSAEDLVKFDVWYKGFYPYSFEYLDDMNLEGKDVLEIGVGMGTVSRYLASTCGSLTLLDIAPGALDFVISTIPDSYSPQFFCQSVLTFETQIRFDSVIAIGSLHHTGDLKEAIRVAENLLKPGGTILVMVYYAFQPQRIFRRPIRTFHEFFKTLKLYRNQQLTFIEQDEILRGLNDSNSAGVAAPHTEFSSRKLFANRLDFKYHTRLRNFRYVPLLSRFLPRNFFLRSLSFLFGCDLYALGTRHQND